MNRVKKIKKEWLEKKRDTNLFVLKSFFSVFFFFVIVRGKSTCQVIV